MRDIERDHCIRTLQKGPCDELKRGLVNEPDKPEFLDHAYEMSRLDDFAAGVLHADKCLVKGDLAIAPHDRLVGQLKPIATNRLDDFS